MLVALAGCTGTTLDEPVAESDHLHDTWCILVVRDVPEAGNVLNMTAEELRQLAPGFAQQLEQNVTTPRPFDVGGPCEQFRPEGQALRFRFESAYGGEGWQQAGGQMRYYFQLIFNATAGVQFSMYPPLYATQ